MVKKYYALFLGLSALFVVGHMVWQKLQPPPKPEMLIMRTRNVETFGRVPPRYYESKDHIERDECKYIKEGDTVFTHISWLYFPPGKHDGIYQKLLYKGDTVYMYDLIVMYNEDAPENQK